MKYRHEWKHEITYCDRLVLRARLSTVLSVDKHTTDGMYHIRSLYFDNADDKALREKVDGINVREKFRIRFYNGNLSRIAIEKKSKINGLCAKEEALINAQEAQKIVDGGIEWMKTDARPLCPEFYYKMKTQGLKPRSIVDYDREAYVYGPGNVRVTIDYNIRTGMYNTDFLNPDTVTLPAGDSHIILEVKWDEYLPDIVRDLVQLPGRRVTAFSKYEQCRIYG